MRTITSRNKRGGVFLLVLARALHTTSTSIPAASIPASLQYLLDPRHTFIGSTVTRWLGGDALPQPSVFKDQLVLVTGGTAGIGRATATRLAEAGAEVHVTGRSRERGQAVESAAQGLSGSILYHECDLSTRRAAREFVEAFSQKILLPRNRTLDVVVVRLLL